MTKKNLTRPTTDQCRVLIEEMPAQKRQLEEDAEFPEGEGDAAREVKKSTLNVMEFKDGQAAELDDDDDSIEDQVRHAFIKHRHLSSADMPVMISPRPKLNHSDACLILYLIIQIKPFKYVGDRSLLQTRKWEMIQQQYATHELRTGPVVPTIRTLQRHLANAVKLCLTKLENGEHGREWMRPPNTTTNMFEAALGRAELELIARVALLVRPTSSVSDLEWAIFRLTELSDRLRNGNGPDALSLATGQRLDQGADGSGSYPPHLAEPLSNGELAARSFELFTHSVERLRSKLDLSADSDLTTRPVLDGLLRKMTELHDLVNGFNAKLKLQTDVLVKQFQDDVQRIVDSNNENLHAQTCLMQGMVLLFNRK